MESYQNCLDTERQGYKVIKPFLEQVSFQGKYIIQTNILDDQLLGRDIYIQVSPDRVLTADMKAVKGSYNRLFLESLSNRSTGKVGWMLTNQVDLLMYLMLGSGELSVINFSILQAWADKHILENNYYFCKQNRCDQYNDTWGFLVPKNDLKVLGQHYIEANINEPGTYKLPIAGNVSV